MKKNPLALLIAVVIVILLLIYGFAFQVRYDEAAVLTTFDRATPPTYGPSGEIVESGSIMTDAGLYPRWPWPIQKVYKYSTRVQLLEDQLEEQQTADGFAVIVQTYLAWRIEDPLAFYVTLKNMGDARKQLNALLRDVRGIISKYRFDELVNTDETQLKLARIEKEGADLLRKRLGEQDYGIRIEQLGIRRILLPEKVTEKVFERMKATRQRMAASAREGGKAQAASIKSKAQNISRRILAQAERRAQALRTQGDKEAAQYYDAFARNQELAILIERLNSLEQILDNNTTFVLPADQLDLGRPLEGGGSVVRREMSEAREEIAQARQQAQQAQAQLREALDDLEQARKQARDKDEQITRARDARDKVEQALDAAKKKADAAEAARKKAEAELKKAKQARQEQAADAGPAEEAGEVKEAARE